MQKDYDILLKTVSEIDSKHLGKHTKARCKPPYSPNSQGLLVAEILSYTHEDFCKNRNIGIKTADNLNLFAQEIGWQLGELKQLRREHFPESVETKNFGRPDQISDLLGMDLYERTRRWKVAIEELKASASPAKTHTKNFNKQTTFPLIPGLNGNMALFSEEGIDLTSAFLKEAEALNKAIQNPEVQKQIKKIVIEAARNDGLA